MFSTDNHLQHVRTSRPYRGALLWATVLTHADDDGCYRPSSFARLRRDLATGGQEKASTADCHTAIRQAISQGILTPDSDQTRLCLAGAEVAA